MTGFIIDCGIPERDAALAWRVDRVEAIRNGVRDSLPPDAPQSAIDAATVAAILGELHSPKRADTMRMHLLALWPLLRDLARTDPAGFDECVIAYAERVTELPADASESYARRKASTAAFGPR